MKFFKRLFAATPGNNSYAIQENASGNRPNLDYELYLLDIYKRRRSQYIAGMATLRIEEIDKRIAIYEDHINAFFARGKVIICRIISEKLIQLKRAREIVQGKLHTVTH